MNYYPEDIVNNMSLSELQNCDWDALFKQIQQATPINYVNNNNNTISNQNYQNAGDNKTQEIILTRKPIFIPLLGKNGDFETCSGIEIHSTIYLDKQFKDLSTKASQTERGIYDCKICDEPFQTRSSLLTHVKVHQQPFCSLCLTPFKTISGYRVHNNKFHNSPWIKGKGGKEDPPPAPEIETRVETEEEKVVDESSNDSVGSTSSSSNSVKETKEKNSYNLYESLDTVTLTSKYGRRRKVIDMSAVTGSRKNRKSK